MIRQREFLGRNRRHVALVAVLAALSFAVALEHSGFEHPEMGDAETGPIVSMCLAIVAVGGALVGALTRFRFIATPRAPLVIAPGPTVRLAAAIREAPPPRAGPSELQVFLR